MFEDTVDGRKARGYLPWGWWTEGASAAGRRAVCLPGMPRYVSCGQSNWFLKPETTYIFGLNTSLAKNEFYLSCKMREGRGLCKVASAPGERRRELRAGPMRPRREGRGGGAEEEQGRASGSQARRPAATRSLQVWVRSHPSTGFLRLLEQNPRPGRASRPEGLAALSGPGRSPLGPSLFLEQSGLGVSTPVSPSAWSAPPDPPPLLWFSNDAFLSVQTLLQCGLLTKARPSSLLKEPSQPACSTREPLRSRL